MPAGVKPVGTGRLVVPRRQDRRSRQRLDLTLQRQRRYDRIRWQGVHALTRGVEPAGDQTGWDRGISYQRNIPSVAPLHRARGIPDDGNNGATWQVSRNISSRWTQQGDKLIGSGGMLRSLEGTGRRRSLSAEASLRQVGGVTQTSSDTGATWYQAPRGRAAEPVGSGATWRKIRLRCRALRLMAPRSLQGADDSGCG
jgi:hypothetical protein